MISYPAEFFLFLSGVNVDLLRKSKRELLRIGGFFSRWERSQKNALNMFRASTKFYIPLKYVCGCACKNFLFVCLFVF